MEVGPTRRFNELTRRHVLICQESQRPLDDLFQKRDQLHKNKPAQLTKSERLRHDYKREKRDAQRLVGSKEHELYEAWRSAMWDMTKKAAELHNALHTLDRCEKPLERPQEDVLEQLEGKGKVRIGSLALMHCTSVEGKDARTT